MRKLESHQISKNCFIKNKPIIDDEALKGVPYEVNLNLLLEIKGGTNFCDVCYEQSLYACEDCSGKTFCKDCCMNIHRHPDRRDHAPYILSSPDDTPDV